MNSSPARITPLNNLPVLATVGLCLLHAFAPAGAAGPDDPFFNSKGTWKQDFEDQWGLKRAGFTAKKDSAWRIEDGRKRPVVVAVIDSGLDYHHPDLNKRNLWRNPKEQPNNKDDDGNGYVDDLIGWDFIDNDNRPFDRAGHGTFVAGIIAAASGNGLGIAGVNPGVRIMPLRALNFRGRGRGAEVAAAIYYAVANGARVINLSLGSQHISRLETDAIDYATQQNVLVVVAGGNEGKTTKGHGMAGLAEVITVGASGLDDKRAPFSNYGDEVDVVAPGVDILSLRARRTDLVYVAGAKDYAPGTNFVGPENMFYRASGTSFAAPFVTGVASLIYAAKPKLKPSEVKRMILHSARDIDPPGKDEFTGYGLLDAAAALKADPAFFIEAAISGVGVVEKGGATFVQVAGTADADKLKSAWIEIGQGEHPQSFKKVTKDVKQPVRGGAIGDIPAAELAGSAVWTLRVVTEHKNGRKREGRFVLKLG